MTSEVIAGYTGIDDAEYRRRIRAWTLYDWANSAFFTTVLAAVLPVYYSQVAGSTLGSPAKATQYWTITLSVALVIIAILSPILGTLSDILRAKKAFLAMFTAIGTMGVGLLVLVDSGDWLLASAFLIIGRIGAAGAIIFYDSLLPHVARPEDQDRVSTRGYAIGYLGGGLLLAINIVMIFTLGDTLGPRLSFVSVAVWWAVFSIPILRRVPEPPAAGTAAGAGFSILGATISRLRETFANLRRYRHLFRYLIAFLIYNDGIGTIIGVAVIYGAELGFGSIELVAAILLVQFVGIPFSLIFGRIPSRDERFRAVFLAFVLWNLIVIPLAGFAGRFVLPGDVTGERLPEFDSTATAVGEGEYGPGSAATDLSGAWVVRSEGELPSAADGAYAFTSEVGDEYRLSYHGQKVEVTYAEGPNRGEWAVLIDGEPVLDGDDPLVIDGYNRVDRFGLTETIDAGEGGEHLLSIVNTAHHDEDATGTVMSIGQAEVLPAPRVSSLGSILGLLLVIEVVGLALASLFGRPLVGRFADSMTTKRTIILSLVVYSVIAVWGFVLDTVIEFWYLAWMVAIVQGGSQALSRSLYASMSPTTESGEFFGFFSVMSKMSAVIGPLVFALAVGVFGSSRPAVLSIIVFFLVGIVLLLRVDVDEGRRAAREADREAAAARLVRGA